MLPGKGVLRAPASRETTTAPLQKHRRLALSDLILHIVSQCPGRKGASLPLIKKVLAAEGYDVARNSGRLKAALGRLLDKELLKRVTGSGVAGSFRIGKKKAERSGRRGRAAGETSKRPAGKRKGPRRAKATAQRLKKGGRPRGRPRGKVAAAAEQAAGGAERAAGPALAAAES